MQTSDNIIFKVKFIFFYQVCTRSRANVRRREGGREREGGYRERERLREGERQTDRQRGREGEREGESEGGGSEGESLEILASSYNGLLLLLRYSCNLLLPLYINDHAFALFLVYLVCLIKPHVRYNLH